MKGLRGRRRGRGEQAASPLELALRPALVEGRWQVPDRFNLARDVVEALAGDPKRQALTFIGADGIIEPRTFMEIAEGASQRASELREHGVHPKDRVIVMAEISVDWLEIVLGIMKVGAVTVPALPSVSAATLEALHSSTGASLVVARTECSGTIEQMTFAPEVVYTENGARKKASDTLKAAPTHDTSSRDLAFVFTTPGTGGAPKEVAHTHGAVFAARVQAQYWLDAGRGDVVWCTADADSPLASWFTLAGPWSRGAEIVLHQGEFDAQERLEHLYRLGPTILCQSAAEYRALAQLRKLERFRPAGLRRLVSTGDVLEPELVEIFQARWGLPVHDGYGQTETGIVVADGEGGEWKTGSIGRPLPGYEIAIVDDQGNALPAGVEGDLAIRGHPPTLFAGYWDAPDETKRAFRGDWYLTEDVAVADEHGLLAFVARADDVITSSGRTFGPAEVEHVLRSHNAIAEGAVVGIRDLQRGGHFVRAFVVPVAGTEGSEQLEAELRQYLGQVLPEQQVPREIVFVEELPIVRGRVSRRALRELPLPGRPLWDLPPTSQPEAETPPVEPEPPQLRVAEQVPAPVPQPTPIVVEEVVPPPEPRPEPVVPPPEPEPVVVQEVAVEIEPEPVVVTPEPAEPVAIPEEPPVVVVEPEPVVVPEVAVSPDPQPVVVSPEPAEPVATPEEPPVVVVEPEPVVVPEVALAATSEPVAEPAPAPAPPPEPEIRLAPALEPEEAEPVSEEVEPEPAPEPAAEAPVAEELEPEPRPALRIARPPETPEERSGRDVASREDESTRAVREPEPDPNLGPLPDYVVAPGSSSERKAASAPPPPPELEPEPDLGPLPDYIVDPSRPVEPRSEPTTRQAAHSSLQSSGFGRDHDPDPAAGTTAGMFFPPVTSFPLPRDGEDDDDVRRGEGRKPKRRRPPADAGKAKRKRSLEEPGDETSEASWMAGLSNRLSAYSLAEEGEGSEDDDASDDGASVEPRT